MFIAVCLIYANYKYSQVLPSISIFSNIKCKTKLECSISYFIIITEWNNHFNDANEAVLSKCASAAPLYLGD